MNPQSLLITLTDPPQFRVQDALLEDYVSSKIDDIPVFATVAPWNPMHDLLVDREARTLAGIVYPVAARERAAIAAICQSLPTQVVRYCVSPVTAAALLRTRQVDLITSFSETGDPNVHVKQFPEALRPYRQVQTSGAVTLLDRGILKALRQLKTVTIKRLLQMINTNRIRLLIVITIKPNVFALFGVMTVLAGIDLVNLRNHSIVKGEGTRKNVRTTLIWVGIMIVSVFFGLVGTLLSNLANFSKPVIAIWVATFVSTLAFYPFRGEQEKELSTFPLWAIYCALMGFVSVGVSYLHRLLD